MTSETDLRALGDVLERAANRDLGARRRRLVLRAAAIAVAAGAIGVGAAIGAGAFSANQVEAGMPAGSWLFGDTHPTCALQRDSVTYACTLASAPTWEYSSDWLDAKEVVTIDKHVAGGCVGLDHAGLRWHCYLGEESVKRGIIGKDFLGEYAPAPGHG